MGYREIKHFTLSNFLTSGFDFDESESHLQFKFRTLNYFMAISVFFAALIGILGKVGFMTIGEIQPIVNIIYAFYNSFLIIILRKNKKYFRKIVWAQVIVSLIVFIIALITVLHDEFRIAWFYVLLYFSYMLLGERSGNVLTFLSIIIIIVLHFYFDLQLSDTAIQTAIFSLIVFGLLSRVYTSQVNNYENQLRNKNNDLAESIIKLDIALEDAQAASKIKSLFLANMSHEIRTPMNGILSLVQVLQTTKVDEKQQEYLHSIDRAGGILIRLIDDLLDLSRIESGKLEINANVFKLCDFIDDILLQVEYLFVEKDVSFNVAVNDELPACLVADDVRLKQVVINLINNASKFTSQGKVNFILTGEKISKDIFNLHMEVTDTGIGIAKEKIECIFEPFQQLSPARIYNKGVGLGLPISRRIIDAMDGKIKVDSVEGKGSCFILDFYFPIAELDDVKKEKIIRNISFKPVTMLIVEDDKISRFALKTLLSSKGHDVVITENGEQAVNFLRKNNVDAILMDVHMPEMNGIEATKIIKEQNLSQAPIIGMTASVMNDERKSYISAGMDVLVEKPVNFEILMGIIKNQIIK